MGDSEEEFSLIGKRDTVSCSQEYEVSDNYSQIKTKTISKSIYFSSFKDYFQGQDDEATQKESFSTNDSFDFEERQPFQYFGFDTVYARAVVTINQHNISALLTTKNQKEIYQALLKLM